MLKFRSFVILIVLYLPVLAIGQCDTTLFISEYIEGSGSFNKCIEIYNPSAMDYTFDPNTDTLLLFVNGSPITDDDFIPLTGTISGNGTFVLCRPGFDVSGTADIENSTLNFNGDDAIALKIGGVIVDLIGTIGEDPGTDWECFDNETSGGTLIRNSNIVKGNPNGFPNEDSSSNPLCGEWTYFEEDYSELNMHEFSPVNLGGCDAFEAPLSETIVVCDGESTKINLMDQATVPDNYNEIRLEDFEDNIGYSVSNGEYLSGDDNYFRRTSLDAGELDSRITYENTSGYFFGAMDNDNGGRLVPDSLILDPIDISGESNLRFSIMLAEDDTGTSEHWDLGDFVRIYYQIDNGGYQPLLFLASAANNSKALIDSDYNGIGDGEEITDTFTDFQINIPGTGNTLDILIEVTLKSNDVDIAMDNIRILSADVPTTAFNFYNDDPECGGSLLASNVLMYDPMVTAEESPVTIYVTTTDRSCETDASPIEIIVNPLPDIVPEALDSLVCLGDDIELSENGMDADSWTWTAPDGTTSTGQTLTIMNATLNDGGTYKVVGTITATSCSDSAIIVVNVVDDLLPPELSVTTACSEESAIIIPPSTFVTRTGDAENLFFSEYIEGTSNNKCLEIYNATGGEVDLANYSIQVYSNGATEASNTYPLAGVLADRATFVICNPSAAMEFKERADILAGSVTGYNGNDVVVLLENEVVIDVIGRIGEDPGDEWSNGGVGTMDASLIRNPDIIAGDGNGDDVFDPSSEYTDLGTNVLTDLGRHTYSGLMDVPVLFNFYDSDPAMPGATLLAGPAATYSPGTGGVFYVTSVYDDCESELAAEIEIIISPGIQELACSPVQTSVPYDCDLDFSPSLFLGNMAVPEMLVVEILQGSEYIPIDQISTDMYGKLLSYRLRDTCNEHSCWNTLIIEDKRPPEILVEPLEFACGEDYSIATLGYPEVIECSDYTITHTDVMDGDYCSDNKLILRTFNAKDEFGNKSQVVQEIRIKSALLDDITGPLEEVVTDCGRTTPEQILAFTGMPEAAYPTIDGKPVLPGLFCNLTIWYNDKDIEVCDESCTFSSKIKRTWHILDWCNNESEPRKFEQLISAKDTTPPTLPGDTLYQTYSVDPWSCVIDRLELPSLPAFDNCSENVELIVYGSAGITVQGLTAFEVPVGEHTFEYRGVDCCGNLTVEPRVLIITVKDEIPPIAIAKEFTVVNVTDYINLEDDDANGTIRIYPQTIDNGSWDNCGIISYQIRRDTRDRCDTDTDEYGPFVSFCCDDIDSEIDVWLRVVDSTGNAAETWGRVKIEDKILGIECFDITIACHVEADEFEDLIEDATPIITTQFCNETIRTRDRDYIITYDYSYYNRNCSYGDIYVTWVYEDDPRLSCVQKVTVEYKGEFSCANIYWPEEEYKELSCADDYTPDLYWDAGPCQLIGWNLKSDTFQFETDACAKIINEYTVIDWCIYDASLQAPSPGRGSDYIANCNKDHLAESERGVYVFTEIIKIIDSIPPAIQICEPDTFLVLTSDCSTDVTLYNVAIDSTDCERLPLNWQLVVVGPDDEIYTYEKSGYSGVEVSFNLSDIDFRGPMETYEVRWKVWDGCGNTDHCITEFTILDKKPPTPYCKDISSALMENGLLEIWAIDFDLDSYDNCSPSDSLRFTFAGISPDRDYVHKRHYFNEDGIIQDTIVAIELYMIGEAQLWLPALSSSAKMLTCDDLPSTVQEMTIWDEKWNYDYCEVNLTLTDNDNACDIGESLSGEISLEDGRKINGVNVELLDNQGSSIAMSKSDLSGVFSFGEINIADGMYIVASMDDGDYDGITTQDVLILQDHILQRKLLDSPYKVIGGDVNRDRQLSALDMLLIQRRAINLTNRFSSGDWQFVVPGDYMNIEDALDKAKTIIAVNEGLAYDHMDFMGVRMGDLNGDVTLGLREGLKTRSNTILDLELVEKENEFGSEIGFYSTSDDVGGLQLSIDLNSREVIRINAEGSGRINHHITGGILYLSYINELSSGQGDLLFSINFAENSKHFQENISLVQEQFRNEIYSGDRHTAHPLNLVWRTVPSIDEEIAIQNRPNPFIDQTFIDFRLPDPGQVGFKFFAVDGKELFKINVNGLRGANKILIQKEDLGYSSGIVYYQMTYGDQVYNGKMILLE